MKTPSIIFMGTTEFAVPALTKLHEKYRVQAVVTVPDKPAGRGRMMQSSPIANVANELDIPLYKPETLSDKNFIAMLQAMNPDIIVVIAFRILPKEVYSLAKLGAFNIHGSLLPKYRGAAPIQWAIINGEQKTGLTSFLLNDKVDTGNIIATIEHDITPDMTAGELFHALSSPAAELAIHTCEALIHGTVHPILQQDDLATPAPKLFREQCKIDWTLPCKTIHDLVRGTNPKPGAWTLFNGSTLKIITTTCSDLSHLQPGEFSIIEDALYIGTGSTAISLLRIQSEGKPAMNIKDFLRGYRHNKQGHCS